jgi:phosphoserine phosphatase
MKKYGATCALVSGGFTVFTERIAERVGFDIHQANTLEIEGGKLKGTVAEPILGREAKRAALERLAAEHRLDISQTLAVGDGANDLAMIRAAGLGVAYRAKPIVAAEARASVVHGDLTALLYLQGYTRDEFVA